MRKDHQRSKKIYKWVLALNLKKWKNKIGVDPFTSQSLIRCIDHCLGYRRFDGSSEFWRVKDNLHDNNSKTRVLPGISPAQVVFRPIKRRKYFKFRGIPDTFQRSENYKQD